MAMDETMDVKRGTREGHVVTFQGKELKIPAGWELLPPGDAGLTRRVKKDGPHWVVKDLEESRRRLSGYRQGLKRGETCPIWRAVYPGGC